MPFDDGPYLIVACLCENVVERKDGVITLVNIIDRVTITSSGPSAPDELPPSPYTTNLVVAAKPGRARGRFDLRFTIDQSDGTLQPGNTFSFTFDGPDDRGVQLIQPMSMMIRHEGLHWINIYYNDALWTKIPLRVIYNRIVSTGPGQAPAQP